MAVKQNYRQAKRQKEMARLVRQQEKLQKKGVVAPETPGRGTVDATRPKQ
jgi:hypothetical protein